MKPLLNPVWPARAPWAVSAAAAAALLMLGGCATKTTQPAWRIVPVQAVAHGAGSAEGYYAIGRQIEHTRDWSRAADAYRQALQVDPGHVNARNALAVALVRLGLLGDAETQLRQALAAAPQRADLHSNLGFLLLLTQRPQEAQVALHMALALDPQDRVARANLQLAQGHAPASATASTALAQAGTSAATAVATTSPAAAVPAAAAPPGAGRATALQIVDRPTLLALQPAPREDKPMAITPAARAPVPVEPAEPGLLGAVAAAAPAAPAAAAVATPVMVHEGPLAVPRFTLELGNGNGRRGVAQELRQQLQRRGFEVQRTANLLPYQQAYTVVSYRPGHEAAARHVAKALPLSVPLQPDAAQRAGVRVLIGHDWPGAARVADAGGSNRE
jgi:Flp pilus assembly protein TadD